jgi:hypothetical protein
MKKIVLLTLFFALTSCNKDVVFSETIKDFPQNQWKASEAKIFSIGLKEAVETATINLHFSHVDAPGYVRLPLVAVLLDPTGKEEYINLTVNLKDSQGNSLSDCAGDVCDLITPVKKRAKLAKGDYKLILQNKFPAAYVPNILALGVSVKQE